MRLQESAVDTSDTSPITTTSDAEKILNLLLIGQKSVYNDEWKTFVCGFIDEFDRARPFKCKQPNSFVSSKALFGVSDRLIVLGRRLHDHRSLRESTILHVQVELRCAKVSGYLSLNRVDPFSWGLNWGFAYELPHNSSYFKEDLFEGLTKGIMKRSIETKPMMQRRFRRDLFGRLEVIMRE